MRVALFSGIDDNRASKGKNDMKTYKEVIKREGKIALSKGFSGEGTEPGYMRVDLIAYIFEKTSGEVREDIIKSRDLPETYKKVYGK